MKFRRNVGMISWDSFQQRKLRISKRQLERAFGRDVLSSEFGRLSLGNQSSATYACKISNGRVCGINPPRDYEGRFDAERSPFYSGQFSQLLLEVADAVTENLFPRICDEVIDFFKSKSVPMRDEKEWKPICDAFRNYVPAQDATDLSQIMNAAWDVYLDETYMKELEAGGRRRVTMLNELVLKSIEVLEMNRISQIDAL